MFKVKLFKKCFIPLILLSFLFLPTSFNSTYADDDGLFDIDWNKVAAKSVGGMKEGRDNANGLVGMPPNTKGFHSDIGASIGGVGGAIGGFMSELFK